MSSKCFFSVFQFDLWFIFQICDFIYRECKIMIILFFKLLRTSLLAIILFILHIEVAKSAVTARKETELKIGGGTGPITFNTAACSPRDGTKHMGDCGHDAGTVCDHSYDIIIECEGMTSCPQPRTNAQRPGLIIF